MTVYSSDPPQYDACILIRLGEIALKGLNRGRFEKQLIRNIRDRIRDLGRFQIEQQQSRIWLTALDPVDYQSVLHRIQDVFGLVSASLVRKIACDQAQLEAESIRYVGEILADLGTATFKVETRRINKSFNVSSYAISADLGALLLETFPGQLQVDVHQPDFTLHVEVREAIFLYHDIVPAQKGLPVGMSGRGLLLLSGGLDSPVAGYRMASRGMSLEAVYFHTYPYTSDEAKQKVVDLARALSRYAGPVRLHVVDFTEIQLTLNDHSPPELLTLMMRRMMVRIAGRLAERLRCKVLISGESLGQVASQTLEALLTTDDVADRPIFRPLIGMDKEETIALARRIGTYGISTLPYDDCCTVFVAKHPKTHPRLSDLERAEAGLDLEALIAQGLERVETIAGDNRNFTL